MTKIFSIVFNKNHQDDLKNALEVDSEDFMAGVLRKKKMSATEE